MNVMIGIGQDHLFTRISSMFPIINLLFSWVDN